MNADDEDDDGEEARRERRRVLEVQRDGTVELVEVDPIVFAWLDRATSAERRQLGLRVADHANPRDRQAAAPQDEEDPPVANEHTAPCEGAAHANR
jgi:hypothetical protein